MAVKRKGPGGPKTRKHPKKPAEALPALTLDIRGYAAEGQGVASLPDGMTCFVSGALAGETCLVRLDKVGKSAAWGHVTRVLAPSPERQAPDCSYYVNCGGCALRHMTYAEELRFKAQKVRDCLTRIGGWDPGQLDIYRADNTQRYRNKGQFPLSPGPEGPRIGFYAKGTHAVTDVHDCLLQSAGSAAARLALKDFMSTYHVPAYDERTGEGLIRHLYVRTNQKGEHLVCILVNGDRLPRENALVEALKGAVPGLKGVVLGVNEGKNNVILGDSYRLLWGQDHLMDRMCGLDFKLSVPSFYQVNTPQAEKLYDLALDFAALRGGDTALDLYCGIGTITLCLARKARRTIGAEVVPQAIEDAWANAARNGITNAEFFCGDADEVAARLAGQGLHPQVVTVDPPRKGLAEGVVHSIVKMAPERVVYVSCDPATLARDVKRFTQGGYAPQKAVAVDLFPRTHHVESVVLLSRKGIDSRKQAAP